MIIYSSGCRMLWGFHMRANSQNAYRRCSSHERNFCEMKRGSIYHMQLLAALISINPKRMVLKSRGSWSDMQYRALFISCWYLRISVVIPIWYFWVSSLNRLSDKFTRFEVKRTFDRFSIWIVVPTIFWFSAVWWVTKLSYCKSE